MGGSPCLLKKPSLDPTLLDKFHSVFNLPFLGKAVGKVVGAQLKRALDAVFSGAFSVWFQTWRHNEMALTMLEAGATS